MTRPGGPPVARGGAAGVGRARKPLQGDTLDCEALRVRQSEASFMLEVTDALTLHKWAWWHDAYSRWNKRGLPDLIAVRPPRLLFLELKAEDGRVTREQQEWLALLALIPGVVARVVRPSDWPEVERLLV